MATPLYKLPTASSVSGNDYLVLDQADSSKASGFITRRARVSAALNPVGGTFLSPTIITPIITTPAVTGGTWIGGAWTGGSIDGTPIGATVPSTGAFSTLTANGLAVATQAGVAAVYQTIAGLADLASAANGAGLSAWRPSLNYVAGTIGKALSDRVWSITDYPFLAVGDGVTDNYAAILAAQTALAAAGGGTLLVPEGTFRYLTAIPRVAGVDYCGLGWASILNPVSCSAFTYAFTSGFGQSVTRDMWLQASSGTAQIGIYQAGTLNDANELYGVLIENCAITGFNVGIQFRTVRHLTIRNNWIQDINSGINLIGKAIVVHIHHNKIVRGSGSGAGNINGILLDAFNYTSGAGVVGPEGIQIETNLLYAFETSVKVTTCNYCNITNNDILGTVYGIDFSTGQNGFFIRGNYIEVLTGGTSGILGRGLGGQLIMAKIVIESNACITSGSVANAIQINESGNTYQYHVDILRNVCFGFSTNDILVFAAGPMTIEGNHCLSTAPTNSIRIDSIILGPVFLDKNHCTKAILYDAASPGLVIGTNTESLTTVSRGGVNTLTGAGAVSLVTLRTTIVTTGANALTLANGYEGQDKYLTMKTDGGDATLTPANLSNGTTITFNDVGDSAHLIFTDGEWSFMGGTATLA